jgi:hypothetical protein
MFINNIQPFSVQLSLVLYRGTELGGDFFIGWQVDIFLIFMGGRGSWPGASPALFSRQPPAYFVPGFEIRWGLPLVFWKRGALL